MKKEKDLRDELAHRKFKKTNPVFYFIYYMVMHIFVGKKYKPEYKIIDDIRKETGPCFIIWNHLSRLDHINVLSVCYPRRFNIVCAYNEFFRSHLAWAFKHNNVLPKKQYTNDLQTIKAMTKIIRQNGIVGFAPEGLSSNYGTNQPIVPGTAHLFKHFKVPVYFLELRGQYLTNHKTSLDERYGKTYAKLKLMFTKEQIETLSEQEMEDQINLAFKHDEYEWQRDPHILNKKTGELERIKWETHNQTCANLDCICYKCPKCGEEFVMDAKDDHIECKHCGNSAVINEYYDVIPGENSDIPVSPSKWVLWERQEIIREIRENPQYRFTEHVKLGRIPNDHTIKDHKTSEPFAEGELVIDHKGMHFDGAQLDGSPYHFFLSYKEVYTLITMLDITYVNIYVQGEYTDIFPERHSGGKMLLLIEEMHRLHVNYFKNFPWMDYLYKDYKEYDELMRSSYNPKIEYEDGINK